MLEDVEPFLQLIALGGGLLVALLVLALIGRGMRGGSRRGAQAVVGLTAGHALHVVELEGRRLLLGTGPSGPPSLLLELDDRGTPPWAGSRAEAPSFPLAADAPPWVAEAARRGPEGWSADGR